MKFHDLTVSYKLVDVVNGFPFVEKDKSPRYHYKITVKRDSSRRMFDYYSSINDYQNGKKELEENDLKFALECILSDAIAGLDTFSNFCSEFGYDENSRNAEKVWKACKRSSAKLLSLGLLESQLYDYINEIRE
jgi:hypothetical protein